MGGPGIPGTSPGHPPAAGVDPPDPDRSWSDPFGVLDLKKEYRAPFYMKL